MFELTGGSQHLDVRDLFADDRRIVAIVHETATRVSDGAVLDVLDVHVHQIDDHGKVIEFRDVPQDPVAHDRFFSSPSTT